ncbi:MAG: hypothetical protein UV76_C0011G0016 [Candidatus Nomurabacteria bacterium GW2011_GWA2_43_15]|uniref:Caib/baif family protein n=2 Tax=Candidatus Nomuraibacteriota TaxID=1752729 RepID=A0A0G1GNN9_9BACT|nr:MAG: hypothetical protein UV76_C0011G0016 [Candidatus Nomurabacteria bacterium GW2011_GWA2_43_15]KKT19056.1 MAG: hypothetical protein UW02_C0016G0030 [Candidatus Nomurabacteria bacterium GW2011_GWB1_43_7]
MYPAGTKFPVYCHDCWWSDKWDPLSYGRDYNFNKFFFEQFKELYNSVPKASLIHYPPNENVTWSNFIRRGKNIYLSYSISTVGSMGSEDVYYSYSADGSKNCFDCSILQKGENCYENIEGFQNYNSYFLIRSRDCLDSAFLFDCVNCQKCFMSSNLRNGKYVFYGQQLSKEEYEEKLKNINSGSAKNVKVLKKEFDNLILKAIHKFANITKAVNCTGDDIINSKNTHYSFNVHNDEDCKYLVRAFLLKGSMDVQVANSGELDYEAISPGLNSFKFLFSMFGSNDSRETSYSNEIQNSSNLFACLGLRNKEYCILNKQYAKDEYEALVPKIIQHMKDMPYTDKLGKIYKYGEFFPPEFSPFGYNETVAQEFFPSNAQTAGKFGYNWKVKEARNRPQPTILPENLPDHIKDVPDSIIKEIIACEHKGECDEQCTSVFKIVQTELEFYRHINLPLPRLCPNCRHYQRLKQRNPLKLWHRKCMKEGCTNEFETSYAPDRPEKVYCERCYQQEVY